MATGSGATFRVTLPVEADAVMARPRPSVLVVDDDAATRQGLTVLLESWGYQASEAADGKAALDSLRQRTAPRHRHRS